MASYHRRQQTLPILAAYVAFGVLHELAHLVAASWLLPNSSSASWGGLLHAAARAVLGRYSVVQLPSHGEQIEGEARMILHAGWIFSLLLALVCHWLHTRVRSKDAEDAKQPPSSTNIFLSPTLPLAAYVTAMEAIATDLLGFVPIHPYYQDSSRLICFCGNFGVLLLNPSWLSIDGGRTALDVLEKMINVTMMRGMFI